MTLQHFKAKGSVAISSPPPPRLHPWGFRFTFSYSARERLVSVSELTCPLRPDSRRGGCCAWLWLMLCSGDGEDC